MSYIIYKKKKKQYWISIMLMILFLVIGESLVQANKFPGMGEGKRIRFLNRPAVQEEKNKFGILTAINKEKSFGSAAINIEKASHKSLERQQFAFSITFQNHNQKSKKISVEKLSGTLNIKSDEIIARNIIYQENGKGRLRKKCLKNLHQVQRKENDLSEPIEENPNMRLKNINIEILPSSLSGEIEAHKSSLEPEEPLPKPEDILLLKDVKETANCRLLVAEERKSIENISLGLQQENMASIDHKSPAVAGKLRIRTTTDRAIKNEANQYAKADQSDSTIKKQKDISIQHATRKKILNENQSDRFSSEVVTTVEKNKSKENINEFLQTSKQQQINDYGKDGGPRRKKTRSQYAKRPSFPIFFSGNGIQQMQSSMEKKNLRSFVGRKKAKRVKRRITPLEIEMLEGATARLPCDLTTSNKIGNAVQLVLWMKQGMHTPLYSYDYGDLVGGLPKETKPDSKSSLGRRTSFQIEKDVPSAALIIEKLSRDDGGIYRCRVDFLLSQTKNARVNLTVVVPPSRAKVQWKYRSRDLEYHVPLDDNSIGPFRQEEQPVVLCSNDDAFPPPKVIWYEGDRIIDESFDVIPKESNDQEKELLVSNEMQLSPLSRRDMGRRFTCQVSNVNISQPATATVVLTMTLNILSVTIQMPRQLEANMTSGIQCNVLGSIPAPKVKWWIGSKKLDTIHPKTLEDGNLTISLLEFTPKPENDGALLICQAVNPQIPDNVVQDTKLISVNYIPVISVRLGRSLNSEMIKEGDDVYFECSVQAKPSIDLVQWKHDGVLLKGDKSIFVSNMSLVVQNVNRSHEGTYTCHAANLVGKGISLPLYLDVKYSPVCVDNQKQEYSVAKLENAEILCEIHANPPGVTFRWTFNNTAEAIDVPSGRFVVKGTASRVNYTPMNELDYGTLLCWANNSIGVQQHPCVFQIISAGKPDPPHDCRIFDVTISSFQVTCLAGDSGGLYQQFLVQVFKLGSTSPTTEITKPTPVFSVKNLRPATTYRILLASFNEEGASVPVEHKVFTEKVPESQEETSAEPTRDRDRIMTVIPFSIIIGSCVVAIPVVVILTLVIWFRTCRKTNLARGLSNESPTDDHSTGTKGFNTTSRSHLGLPIADSVQTISCKDLEMTFTPSSCLNSGDPEVDVELQNAQEMGKKVVSPTISYQPIRENSSQLLIENQENFCTSPYMKDSPQIFSSNQMMQPEQQHYKMYHQQKLPLNILQREGMRGNNDQQQHHPQMISMSPCQNSPQGICTFMNPNNPMNIIQCNKSNTSGEMCRRNSLSLDDSLLQQCSAKFDTDQCCTSNGRSDNDNKQVSFSDIQQCTHTLGRSNRGRA